MVTGAAIGCSLPGAKIPRCVAPRDECLPTSWPRYVPLRIIGHGGFGVVYACRDTELASDPNNSLVAVKAVPLRCLTDEEVSLALGEVSLLRHLDHPNILRYLDCFVDESEQLCLVTEYVDGGDLAGMVKQYRQRWETCTSGMAGVTQGKKRGRERNAWDGGESPSRWLSHGRHQRQQTLSTSAAARQGGLLPISAADWDSAERVPAAVGGADEIWLSSASFFPSTPPLGGTEWAKGDDNSVQLGHPSDALFEPLEADRPTTASVTCATSPGHWIESFLITDIVRQCLDGLAYLHSLFIVHRDIKPANIYMTREGQVKIGDFGVSKVLCTNDPFTETFVGTPFYFSPELCLSERYSVAADIWALGVLTYELYCLKLPFVAQNVLGQIHMVTEGQYDVASLETPHVFASSQLQTLRKLYGDDFLEKESMLHTMVVELVKRMLVADPTARSSAEQLLSDFFGVSLTLPGHAGLLFTSRPVTGLATDANATCASSAIAAGITSRSLTRPLSQPSAADFKGSFHVDMLDVAELAGRVGESFDNICQCLSPARRAGIASRSVEQALLHPPQRRLGLGHWSEARRATPVHSNEDGAAAGGGEHAPDVLTFPLADTPGEGDWSLAIRSSTRGAVLDLIERVPWLHNADAFSAMPLFENRDDLVLLSREEGALVCFEADEGEEGRRGASRPEAESLDMKSVAGEHSADEDDAARRHPGDVSEGRACAVNLSGSLHRRRILLRRDSHWSEAAELPSSMTSTMLLGARVTSQAVPSRRLSSVVRTGSVTEGRLRPVSALYPQMQSLSGGETTTPDLAAYPAVRDEATVAEKLIPGRCQDLSAQQLEGLLREKIIANHIARYRRAKAQKAKVKENEAVQEQLRGQLRDLYTQVLANRLQSGRQVVNTGDACAPPLLDATMGPSASPREASARPFAEMCSPRQSCGPTTSPATSALITSQTPSYLLEVPHATIDAAALHAMEETSARRLMRGSRQHASGASPCDPAMWGALPSRLRNSSGAGQSCCYSTAGWTASPPRTATVEENQDTYDTVAAQYVVRQAVNAAVVAELQQRFAVQPPPRVVLAPAPAAKRFDVDTGLLESSSVEDVGERRGRPHPRPTLREVQRWRMSASLDMEDTDSDSDHASVESSGTDAPTIESSIVFCPHGGAHSEDTISERPEVHAADARGFDTSAPGSALLPLPPFNVVEDDGRMPSAECTHSAPPSETNVRATQFNDSSSKLPSDTCHATVEEESAATSEEGRDSSDTSETSQSADDLGTCSSDDEDSSTSSSSSETTSTSDSSSDSDLYSVYYDRNDQRYFDYCIPLTLQLTTRLPGSLHTAKPHDPPSPSVHHGERDAQPSSPTAGPLDGILGHSPATDAMSTSPPIHPSRSRAGVSHVEKSIAPTAVASCCETLPSTRGMAPVQESSGSLTPCKSVPNTNDLRIVGRELVGRPVQRAGPSAVAEVTKTATVPSRARETPTERPAVARCVVKPSAEELLSEGLCEEHTTRSFALRSIRERTRLSGVIWRVKQALHSTGVGHILFPAITDCTAPGAVSVGQLRLFFATPSRAIALKEDADWVQAMGLWRTHYSRHPFMRLYMLVDWL